MRRVGLEATASYLPERWMTAAEVADLSGIPEQVLIEKIGLRGKHIAAPDEHVSDLAVEAGRRLLDVTGMDPTSIDVVMYYGSMWRDYAVWQVAPHIAYRLGATRAFAVEYASVSHGTPIALRVARDLLRAEPELKSILMVAACRESYLIDYTNERSRFMFNFGDGAVAGLLVGDATRNEVLGSHAITNGAYSLQVKIPGGGSVDPEGYRFLDVQDPAGMKDGLDQESLPNFVAAARTALERSGLTLVILDFVCLLHTKRSMFLALLDGLGMREDQAVYLDDTGHMSGVDSLLCLDRAVGDGRVRDGDVVLLLSAGTGYTWAATVVRWGELPMKVGDVYGPSSWIEVPQQKIDAFADATGDHQWIHIDPERAATGPFGTTIAHGYLTLSLLPVASYEVVPRQGGMGINYGLNRVRFPAPVPVGSRVRATFEVIELDEQEWGGQATMRATVEREGGDKPVCVAETIFRYYT